MLVISTKKRSIRKSFGRTGHEQFVDPGALDTAGCGLSDSCRLCSCVEHSQSRVLLAGNADRPGTQLTGDRNICSGCHDGAGIGRHRRILHGNRCLCHVRNGKIVMGIDIHVPIIAYFGLAALIGASLGLINGILVGGLGLPTLIVTLGTMSLFGGITDLRRDGLHHVCAARSYQFLAQHSGADGKRIGSDGIASNVILCSGRGRYIRRLHHELHAVRAENLRHRRF